MEAQASKGFHTVDLDMAALSVCQSHDKSCCTTCTGSFVKIEGPEDCENHATRLQGLTSWRGLRLVEEMDEHLSLPVPHIIFYILYIIYSVLNIICYLL